MNSSTWSIWLNCETIIALSTWSLSYDITKLTICWQSKAISLCAWIKARYTNITSSIFEWLTVWVRTLTIIIGIYFEARSTWCTNLIRCVSSTIFIYAFSSNKIKSEFTSETISILNIMTITKSWYLSADISTWIESICTNQTNLSIFWISYLTISNPSWSLP